ncbi:MAG: mannose-6-phosphate isomerase [Thermoleophilaceae bacterium]|nr:mannose-6-phosphate isomerase [Thermoleophilaceae bacterium]
MRPQLLPPNVLHHFYAGGAQLAALRGVHLADDHMPEEWLGAVNTTFAAADGRGLSRLDDGTLVRDAVEADPEAWLGPEHVARFGADPCLLTKLLDAGQRLPVHFHPGRAFACDALGHAHGQTVAGVILTAEPGATVHAGFKHPVELATVREWMRTQDSAAMLAALHELPVTAGDTLFVPAGTPHSIGAGILLVELQEPTDLSVTLEWTGFELGEDDGHLGLGWPRALEALDRSAWDERRLAALRGPITPRQLLPADADPYFRAERVAGGETLDPGFSVLVGIAGTGTLATAEAVLEFGRGRVVLSPYSAGELVLEGDVEGLRCRPPDPAMGEGKW